MTTNKMRRDTILSGISGSGARLLAAVVMLSGALGISQVFAQKAVPVVGGVADQSAAISPARAAVPLLDMSTMHPGLSNERSFLVLTESRYSKVLLPDIATSACHNCGADVAPSATIDTITAAVANAAAAANGDSAMLAGQAAGVIANKGIDELERMLSGFGPVRNVELTYVSSRDARPRELRADVVLAFMETNRSTVIGQVGLFKGDSENEGFNLGLGYRHLTADESMLIGVNAFYDYLDTPTVSRYSIGGEVKGDWFDFSANWYQGIKDGFAPNGGKVESADGWDVELAGRMPEVPWLELSGRYYSFDGGAGDDITGADIGVRFEPMPLVAVEARYDIPENGSNDFYAGVNLKYRFGVPLAEHLSPLRVQTSPVKHKRYDKVRREYQQRLNTFAPPPSNDILLTVRASTTDPTAVVLIWSWLDLGAAQADVRWGQTPVSDDNYPSQAEAPVPRIGTSTTGSTTVTGLVPGISYQFNVRLFATGSATPIELTGNIAVLQIPGTAPPLPQVNVASSLARVNTGENGTITFSVQPRSTAPLTIQFSIASSGVAAGYTLRTPAGGNIGTIGASGGSIEIPANTDSVSLSLQPESTVDTTANGAFMVSVNTNTGYAVGDQSSTTVQIAPAATPVATVSVVSGSTFEGGTAQFTITLDPAPVAAVELGFAISGSGISTGDYSLVGQSLRGGADVVDFLANQGTAVLTLTVTDDADLLAENLVFTISSGAGYLVSSTRGSATLRISPLPLVGISANPTSIVGGGTSTVTVSVNPAPQRTMVVLFSLSHPPDLADGNDFTITGGSSADRVSIAAGQSSAALTVTVPANRRVNGTLRVSLVADRSYNVNLAAAAADIVIAARPRISISASVTRLDEGEATIVTFTSDPAPLADLTVNYAITGVGSGGGDAADFTVTAVGSVAAPGAGMAVIPAGSTTSQLQFMANDDDDGTESVAVSVTAATADPDNPAGYEVNAAARQVDLTVYPLLPVVSFRAVGAVAIAEGGQSTIVISAEGAPEAANPVPVMFMIADGGGGGITDTDFTLTVGGATETSVVGGAIAANVPLGGSLNVVITAVDDGDTAVEELDFMLVTSPTDYTISSNIPIRVTITPNVGDVTNLRSADGAAGEVNLTWTSPATSCNQLEITVQPAGAGGPPPVQTCTPGMEQTVRVTGLTTGTMYTFTVVVIDTGGRRSTGDTVTHTAP